MVRGFAETLVFQKRYSQIHHTVLDAFLTQLEQGYSLNNNPYHNLLHGADVAQTTHFMISQTGLGVSAVVNFSTI